MTKMNGESFNIEENNIKELLQLFPEVQTDGKIDFDKLKQLLGEYVDDSEERYRFVWNGKGEALRLSQTPSLGTLRPDKESSKHWDETKNLYIEGDNLEVLKLLQKSYFGKVKMIYIDPPYNTGGDFVYKDDFKDNIKNYKKMTGQVDGEGNSTTTNREYSGRYHTDWLNMMYPRLRLARNLLTEDGVIFISIDDHEVHNMRKICDEIFGEDNFIVQITRIAKRTSNKGNYFKPTKDYILLYAKSLSLVSDFGISRDIDINQYKFEDEKGKYRQNGASLYQPSLDSRPNQRYFIEAPDGSLLIPPGNVFPKNKKDGALIKPESNADKVWRWSRDSYLEKKDYLIFNKSNQTPLLDENKKQAKWNVYDKVYLEDDLKKTMQPEDVIYDFPNSQGTKELNSLGINFSFSKPVNLLKYIMELLNIDEKDYYVMDFFSGSSTTAHAVMDLNAEDGGNRKFIMVQLPEPTDEKSEAHKAGYENIAEIGKERIRRAGEKIKEELKEKYEKASEEERKEMKHPDDLDIGFKTFTLDSSNIKAWNPGKYKDVQEALEDSVNPYVDDRTEQDVVYEMMLKMGLDLTYPVEEIDVDGKTIYSIGFGFLMICLADDIDVSIAEKMIEIKDEHNQQEFRAIFKDEGFNNDTDKTNVKETLRSAGLAEESFITL